MRSLLALAMCLLIASPAAADLLVDTNAGAIALGTGYNWTGDTTGSGNEADAYNVVSWSETGEDYVYEFTLPANSVFEVTAATFSVDLDLFFLNNLTVDAGTATGALAYGNSTFTTGVLDAGTYYLSVDGYNGVVGTYDITFDVYEDVPPPTMAEASLGTLNNGDTGYGDTTGYQSYWGYDRTGDNVWALNHLGGDMVIDMLFDESEGLDLDLKIFAFDELTQVGSGGLTGDYEHVEIEDLAAGTYYAVVDGWTLEGAYELTYTPEPTTLALLGLGALALVRRRR